MYRASIILIAATLALAGCASSSPIFTTQCDPATETCNCDKDNPCPTGWTCKGGFCDAYSEAGMPDLNPVDKGPVSDGAKEGGAGPDGPLSDLTSKLPFGSKCTDKKQCQSNICLFAGTGGICSKLCKGSPCPKGYNCFGVLGSVEQGKVSEVCVPENNIMCSPCKTDKECSISGADKCITYPDGSATCGRDCNTVTGCPTGYTCDSVTVGGTSYKQCLPDSGACDCDTTKIGTTKACTVTNPLGGSCNGTYKCEAKGWSGGKPLGWSACTPPSTTDAPDSTFTDSNCDGIDGVYKDGVFVSTSGLDNSNCGTHTIPCKTIGYAFTAAANQGKTFIYVQAGTYNEVLELKDGVSVVGGYDSKWSRDVRTKTTNMVTIKGALHSSSDQYVTVVAHSLTKGATLMDLVLQGADASGKGTLGARSSVVVHADTAFNLKLERVTLQAGRGAVGAAGISGLPATTVYGTSAMNGKVGGSGKEVFSLCETSVHGYGGAGGSNSCSGTPSPAGGAGGNGGKADSCCGSFLGAKTCLLCSCTATNGTAGGNAASYVYNSYGYRGSGGYGSSTCGNGGVGKAGRIINGAGGAGGSGGSLASGFWYPASGGGGKAGSNGGGGGAGGGGGGCDKNLDYAGAGGGGGGAGGCAAKSGGGGGGGGGGSFGLLAVASSVTLSGDCVIKLGDGGAGGSGGEGGQGQSGGLGGTAGAGKSGKSGGGTGAKGGHGGHGGGGGGGTGGVSYGILNYKSGVTQACTFDKTSATAGAGGSGGASASSAPVAERDGKSGTSGSSAPSSADTKTCTTTTSCF